MMAVSADTPRPADHARSPTGIRREANSCNDEMRCLSSGFVSRLEAGRRRQRHATDFARLCGVTKAFLLSLPDCDSRYAQDANGRDALFLMKRLPNVATEMALHVLAYNLTRVMNIMGIQPLMAAMTAYRF